MKKEQTSSKLHAQLIQFSALAHVKARANNGFGHSLSLKRAKNKQIRAFWEGPAGVNSDHHSKNRKSPFRLRDSQSHFRDENFDSLTGVDKLRFASSNGPECKPTVVFEVSGRDKDINSFPIEPDEYCQAHKNQPISPGYV